MRSSVRPALVLATLLVAGVAQAQTASPPSPTAAPPAPASPAPAATPAPPMFSAPEYVMGNPRAKVTVTEYASASCPHCARFDINVFPAFKAKYIDTGKIRYVFREFLTPPEQLAAAAFLMARCAGESKYWTVVDAFFHAQEEIYRTGQAQPVFTRIAASVGLSPAQIDACLTNKAAVDGLNERMNTAVNTDKITSTPSFLINGKMAFDGEVDLARLSAAVDTALAKSGPVRHPRSHARAR